MVNALWDSDVGMTSKFDLHDRQLTILREKERKEKERERELHLVFAHGPSSQIVYSHNQHHTGINIPPTIPLWCNVESSTAGLESSGTRGTSLLYLLFFVFRQKHK